MSRLRRLSRKINRAQKGVPIRFEKELKVKNGYLRVALPLSKSAFRAWDMFTDYMLSFAYGDRSMENPKDAKDWKEKVVYYIDGMFGIGSYYKCFGTAVASHEDIGELFSELNKIVAECKEEVKEIKKIITDCEMKSQSK